MCYLRVILQVNNPNQSSDALHTVYIITSLFGTRQAELKIYIVYCEVCFPVFLFSEFVIRTNMLNVYGMSVYFVYFVDRLF